MPQKSLNPRLSLQASERERVTDFSLLMGDLCMSVCLLYVYQCPNTIHEEIVNPRVGQQYTSDWIYHCGGTIILHIPEPHRIHISFKHILNQICTMRCQHVMYKSGTHEMRGRVAASHIRHPLRGNKKEQRWTDCDSRVREEGGGMMKTDDNESGNLSAIST